MEKVLVHVRFAPNGTVTEIGERPVSVSAQQWFNYLSRGTINCYEALAGGRGVFRIAREDMDALRVACVA